MGNLKYFGTDGIRGTAGTDPMCPAFVYRLGQAAGQVLGADHAQLTFLIGRDTRASGPILQQALADGLIASGATVLDLGILPTPGIAYLVNRIGATAGAVISASHNPASENGIKFLNRQGMKLSEALEAQIEALLENPRIEQAQTPGQLLDGSHLYADYEQDLLMSQPGLDLGGMTLVMDCANGAAWKVAPEVMRKLGARVLAINADPDGVINQVAGSEQVRGDPSRLAQLVLENGADIGIAFDGDADRVILMDETGQLIDGDHMLAILADHFHAAQQLLGNAMVTTIMANGALTKYALQRGFEVMETPVGDKYVTEALLALSEKNTQPGMVGIGGEQSGHIVLLDAQHRTGDGLRTALFMLNVIKSAPGQSLATLAERIRKYPQLVASCVVAQKIELSTLPGLQEVLACLQQDLPGLVRYNSRYSGTEPKYRLMLETDTRHTPPEVAAKAWQICRLIQHETGTTLGSKIEVLNVADGGLMPPPEDL